MDRAFKSGASATPPTAPAAPSVGYPTAGDAGSGVPPTKPGPWWYHMITEELRNIVVAAGLTPAQATVNQVLTALQTLFASAAGLFGLSQSWVDVTASRSIGVTYYNTTNRPIQVNATVGVVSSGTSTVSLRVGSGVAQTVTIVYASNAGFMTGVVPAGASYSITLDSGPSIQITPWKELR